MEIHAARRLPSTLFAYLLSAFLPTLLLSMFFFVLILEITDLLSNLFKYLQGDVPLSGIIAMIALYFPKCVSFALPIATLFSASFTLGSLYANNELIVVFGSGISLGVFVFPVIVCALLLSMGSFFFEDAVVLPASHAKTVLYRELLKISESKNSTDITILGGNKTVLWNVKRFDAEKKSLSGITVIVRTQEGGFVSRLDAQSAQWDGEKWIFSGVRRFHGSADGKTLTDSSYGSYSEVGLDETPESFAGIKGNIAEMNISEAKSYIEFRRRTGLPFLSEQSEYYKRYTFAFTPFLVTLLSSVLAGRYRKNILLFSLLLSLGVATAYYVAQMISMLLAKNGIISPFAGAASPLFLFLAAVALSYARKKS